MQAGRFDSDLPLIQTFSAVFRDVCSALLPLPVSLVNIIAGMFILIPVPTKWGRASRQGCVIYYKQNGGYNGTEQNCLWPDEIDSECCET